MRRLILIAALVGLSGCEQADPEPQPVEIAVAVAQACPQFPQDADDGAATRPDIPEEFKSFVQASETTVTVQRKSGPPACIDIAYGEVDSWDSFAGGRLLGIGISGHEYNSYLVVDREGAGEPIETGRAPVFSPSGRRFASIDISESAFGAFEGLGVWELAGGSIRNLVTLRDLLERGYDWRLERWASDDCAVFSSTDETTAEDPDDRKVYQLPLVAHPVLKDVAAEDACRSAG